MAQFRNQEVRRSAEMAARSRAISQKYILISFLRQFSVNHYVIVKSMPAPVLACKAIGIVHKRSR